MYTYGLVYRAELTLLCAEAEHRRPAAVLVLNLTVATVSFLTLEVLH